MSRSKKGHVKTAGFNFFKAIKIPIYHKISKFQGHIFGSNVINNNLQKSYQLLNKPNLKCKGALIFSGSCDIKEKIKNFNLVFLFATISCQLVSEKGSKDYYLTGTKKNCTNSKTFLRAGQLSQKSFLDSYLEYVSYTIFTLLIKRKD